MNHGKQLDEDIARIGLFESMYGASYTFKKKVILTSAVEVFDPSE